MHATGQSNLDNPSEMFLEAHALGDFRSYQLIVNINNPQNPCMDDVQRAEMKKWPVVWLLISFGDVRGNGGCRWFINNGNKVTAC